LIHVIDEGQRVKILVDPGIPLSEEHTIWHGGGMTDQHKQSLRDAAARAAGIAMRYRCSWETNY
jgi:ribosomal protein L21E